MPLREVLDVLARPYEAAIFLDRRLDPDERISMKVAPAPLGRVLAELGEEHGFAVVVVEGVIYLGPEATARQLRTRDRLRRDEARGLTRELAAALLKPATVEWPMLSSPRDLLTRVCGEAGLSLSNPESIPHDLWPAGRLPGVPRITQLTILLAGFDLTFEIGADGTLAVRPVAGEAHWTRDYPITPRQLKIVDEIVQAFPGVELAVQRSRLHVTGRVEEHEAIRQWLQEERRPSESTAPQERSSAESTAARYTLRVVRRPLRDVLQEIERTTPYRFAYDPVRLAEEGGPLGRAVSFEVQQVDIDGLLQALLEPAALSWRRAGYRIKLAPAGSGE